MAFTDGAVAMTYIVCATINAQGVSDPKAVTLENVRDALPGVGLAGLQEVANLRRRWSLRNQLAHRTTGVYQVTDTAATAGVALVWDKSRVRVMRRDIALGVKPWPGDDQRTRYLISADACIDESMFVTAIVGHRPKRALRHLWPAYDRALLETVLSARYPVILFTDNNAHELPRVLRSVLTPYARRIDLIALSEPLMTRGRAQAFDLPATRSDHSPVAIELEVRPGR